MELETAEGTCCGCGGENVPAKTTAGETWPEPNRGQMRFMIGSAIAYLLYGGYLVARRKPALLVLWGAALVCWFTLCKYLICTRCEKYGQACDFFYLGKLASLMFKPQPDRSLDTAGIIAEGTSAAVLQLLPAVVAIGDRKRLVRYLLLLLTGHFIQLYVCCRRCVRHSTDPWKESTCPSYKQALKFWGRCG